MVHKKIFILCMPEAMLSREKIQCFVITVPERVTSNKHNFEGVKQVFPLARQVNAVDARNYTDDQLREVVTDEVYNSVNQNRGHTKGEINSKGAVGCFLSHVECWVKCVQTNRPIIVAEDDADVKDTSQLIQLYESIPEEAVFASLIHSLSPRWFYAEKQKVVNKYWNRVGQDFWGTMMYYIKPAAARILLEQGRLVSMHVDIFISQVAMARENESLWLQSSQKYNQFSLTELLKMSTDSTIKHRASIKKFVPEKNSSVVILWLVPVVVLVIFLVVKKVSKKRKK